MSALESMIASNPHGEAPIHPSLMYELPAPSTAVVDRQQHVRAYPSSATSLSLSGTKTVRIRLGGEGFIDPSSIRLMFTVKNESGSGNLRPFVGPWGCWQQAYLRSNGVELDNIPYYNRFHTQYGFHQLPREDQISVGNEGWGSNKLDDNNFYEAGDIPAGESLTVMHKLHFSIFSAGRLIPVKYAPLEVELTMTSTATDWLLTDAGSSSTWSISDCQILFDNYQLDESVQQSFYSALLKNRVLSIPLMSVYQMNQPLPSGASSYSFSSVRAFSRLAQVWLTFRGTGARAAEFMCPGALPGVTDSSNVAIKNEATPQARLSIGPHNWPDPQPTSGQTSSELFYMLTKALGYSPNITRKAFEEKCFTIVFDLKKMPSDVTTAVSTRGGELVHVQLTNLSNSATECWLTLVSFGVCAIRESGLTLLT